MHPLRGRRRGGARFLRLEGAAWQDGGVVFVASEAGDRRRRQVWRYVPHGAHRGTLKLVYESPEARTLNQPDAIVGRSGGVVVMAEDGNGQSPGGTNFLRVLTPAGASSTSPR
ncbi:MAG: hypothetical protein ABIO16_01450 [Nocardioides sp.]